MTKALLITALFATTLVTAVAQTGNRFPAPLGLDRILTGVIEKSQPSAPSSASHPSRFRLKSNDTVYALHGKESRLKKFVGKQVRIVGHVVGNDVEVQSVELRTSND